MDSFSSGILTIPSWASTFSGQDHGVGAPFASTEDPSSPGTQWPQVGRAYVFSLDASLPNLVRTGSACASTAGSGIAPRIGISTGTPKIDSDFDIQITQTRVGTHCVAWIAFAPLQVPVDLGSFFPSMPGCNLYLQPDLAAPAATCSSTIGSADGLGFSRVELSLGNDASWLGRSFFVQWYIVDPGRAPLPGITSELMELTIGS